MTSLHIDIETYSEVDLKKAGVYRYAEESEIILFAYAYNDELVQVVDLLSGEQIPDEVMYDLTNPKVIKKAFNAAFERANIKEYFNIELPVSQWQCTQARAAMCGLPLNLEQSAAVLGVDSQKDKSGSALIRYFCIPIKKPIKKNEFRTRNLPQHDDVKWQQFKEYNGKDVDAERAIDRALSFYQISEFEHRQWQLDQEINERGVAINIPFVRNAISLMEGYEERLRNEAKDLTGLDNPTSVSQLKKWLFEEISEEVESLNKETIPDILKKTDSGLVKRVLEIRQETSKTSTKKYYTMMSAVGRDGRVRGLHEYYGANRTGRASGRLLQHQNLPRGKFKNIEPIRDLVMQQDPEWLEFTYGAIPDALSSLIRSTLIPAPGHRFFISDFSAVEAVVLAWLAGEDWVLDVFRTHGKIYETTASKMFNLPLETITKDSPYRQKGKTAVLGLGYSGGVNALIKMGALKEGLTEDELPAIVAGWRRANPNIVNFWYSLQKAAEMAIKSRSRVYIHDILIRGEYTAPNHGISFYTRGSSLFFVLPSGRELVYCNVGIEDGEYGERITYWGVDQVKKRWAKLDTYSGKLAENCLISETKVLSLKGWIKIIDVTPSTLLWDGEEWVLSHGVIAKGIQNTISVNGVRMTPNHKILTNEGWKEASSCTGLRRATVQSPTGYRLCGFGREKDTVESKVRLRKGKDNRRERIEKTKNKILRMYAVSSYIRKEKNSRYVSASSIRSMAFNDRPLQITYSPSMAQLRRKRNKGMREMEKVSKFLGRYGANIQEETNFRTDRRKWPLRTRELYMGNYEKPDPKQKMQPLHKYQMGQNNGVRSIREVGDRRNYNFVPERETLAGSPFIIKTGFYEPVFDIVNCGPRNRFVVQDQDGGLLIVHNCTQAVARDLLMNGLQNLDNAGYRIILHVHDESVCEMPVGVGSLEEVSKLMCTLPDWASGMPLKAAGEESFYYKK